MHKLFLEIFMQGRFFEMFVLGVLSVFGFFICFFFATFCRNFIVSEKKHTELLLTRFIRVHQFIGLKNNKFNNTKLLNFRKLRFTIYINKLNFIHTLFYKSNLHCLTCMKHLFDCNRKKSDVLQSINEARNQ